jgi:hypothetical protein
MSALKRGVLQYRDDKARARHQLEPRLSESRARVLGGVEPGAHRAMGQWEMPLRSISPNRCELTERTL